jgi:hypothetical protein
MIAQRRRRDLMLLPGWWWIAAADSAVDYATRMPDILDLRRTYGCRSW